MDLLLISCEHAKICSATWNFCTNEHPNPEGSSVRKISSHLQFPLEMFILAQCLKRLNAVLLNSNTVCFHFYSMNFILKHCNRETQSTSNCSIISLSQSNAKWQRPSGRPAVFSSVIHLPPLKAYNTICGSDLISRQDRRRLIKKRNKVFWKVTKCGTKIHSTKF